MERCTVQKPEDSYRRRLQRDVPTGIAAFLCLIALLLPTIGATTLLVEGPHLQARGHPLYWLLLGLPAIWSWRMMDYTPGALRTIRPTLFATPFLAAAVLIAAHVAGRDMAAYRVMFLSTVMVCTVGGFLYDRSLLAREGAGD